MSHARTRGPRPLRRGSIELLGVQPPVLTGDVYDTFKRMTGFNDDWDLTAGLLRVLLASLPPAWPLAPLPIGRGRAWMR